MTNTKTTVKILKLKYSPLLYFIYKFRLNFGFLDKTYAEYTLASAALTASEVTGPRLSPVLLPVNKIYFNIHNVYLAYLPYYL